MPINTSMHDLCVDISSDIAQLQKGLAHAGASPQALTALSHAKSIFDTMTKVLAQSPDVEHAAQNGPAGGPQGPLAPQTPANATPGDQGPANPTPGAPGGPPPRGPFGGPAQALHQAMSGNARGASR